MATIGTLTVVLSANSAEFANGMDKAAGSIHKLQNSAIGKSLAKRLGLSASDITALSTGVLAATAVIGVFVQALGTAAQIGGQAADMVARWVAESTEAIDTAYKLSSALGITTDSFMGLASGAKLAADMGSSEFGDLLKKMSKSIAESSDGIAALGLNAKELANIPADRQFVAIADAISKLKNPADQIRAALDIFGKGANLQFINWIKDGSEGLEEAKRKALAYGAAVSQLDANSIAAMKDHIEDIQLRWEGIKNTVTISLAPSIITVLETVQAMIPPADELKNTFRLWLFYAAAFGDSVNGTTDIMVKLAAYDIKGLMNWKPDTTFVDFLQLAEKRAAQLSNQLSRMPKPKAIFDADGLERTKGIKTALDSIQLEASTAGLGEFEKRLVDFVAKFKPGTKDIFTFASALQRVVAVKEQLARQGMITDFLEGLRQQSDLAGLEGWAQVRKQLELLGASVPDMMKAMKYQSVIDAAKEHKRILDEIDQAWKDNATPLEKYLTAMDKINELVREGLNIEIAKRMAIKANQDLLSAYRSNDPGVVEARQVRFNLLPPIPRRQDPLDRIAGILAQEKATQDRQLSEAKQTNIILREQGVEVVDIGP